jgi:hypothetical protein
MVGIDRLSKIFGFRHRRSFPALGLSIRTIFCSLSCVMLTTLVHLLSVVIELRKIRGRAGGLRSTDEILISIVVSRRT